MSQIDQMLLSGEILEIIEENFDNKEKQVLLDICWVLFDISTDAQ